ncbi:hypothetical protein CYMTET_27664, partial [Cymbomonas tetramitiformis]
ECLDTEECFLDQEMPYNDCIDDEECLIVPEMWEPDEEQPLEDEVSQAKAPPTAARLQWRAGGSMESDE